MENHHNLILIRHGQSIWNKMNRFTGWVDIDLSSQGVEEARKAGHILKKDGRKFDLIFTSSLLRSRHTANIILHQIRNSKIVVYESWRLNERNYGALQGKNKKDIQDIYGVEQVKRWCRSYLERPPGMNGESLKDTYIRVVDYYESTIASSLRSGKQVIIIAHGNSLRALMKYLLHISDDDISSLEIPTGIPIEINFDENYHGNSFHYMDPQNFMPNQTIL